MYHTLITTIFFLKTNCNQFQIITSFLHLHRQNPAQSCLRMSRHYGCCHGAQDVMARSRVTCYMLRGAGGAGGGGGLRHLPSHIASPPPAGNCSVLTIVHTATRQNCSRQINRQESYYSYLMLRYDNFS